MSIKYQSIPYFTLIEVNFKLWINETIYLFLIDSQRFKLELQFDLLFFFKIKVIILLSSFKKFSVNFCFRKF